MNKKPDFPIYPAFYVENIARTTHIQAVIGPCMRRLIFGILYLSDGIIPQLPYVVDIIVEMAVFTMQFYYNGVRLRVSVRVRVPLPYMSIDLGVTYGSSL